MIHLFLLYLPGTKKEITMLLLEFLVLACSLQQALIITIYPLYYPDRCPSVTSGIESTEESQCVLLINILVLNICCVHRIAIAQHCSACKKLPSTFNCAEFITVMRKVG